MNLDVSTIEREYSFKRMNAIKLYEEYIQKAYNDSPELSSINIKIKELGLKASKCALSPNDKEQQKTKNALLKEVDELKNKKQKILFDKGISLEPQYECDKCKDTGYIVNGLSSKMCSCMKQRIIDYYYNKFNTYKLQNETFENFNEELFSDTVDEEKYKSKVSPRDNINKIKKFSMNFIKKFEDESTKNLLFIGNTGVGKTFISGCIANEMIKKGHTVLYQTAPILMDSIFEFKYGNKSKLSKELYDSLFDVDLLIIDDLGTESQSSAKFTELFSIINSRMLNPKVKTIISTNLNLKQLSNLYDDRIVSRLVGQYNICKFFGDDIRTKK